MPPRDDQKLPEGTDQIINGAMETGAGAGASTGSGFGGVGQGGTNPGGSADFAGAGGGFGGIDTSAGTGTTGSSGFIGASGGDDTGGFAGGGSGSDLGGGSSSGSSSMGGTSAGLGGGSDFGGGAAGMTSTSGSGIGGGSDFGGSGGFGGGSDDGQGGSATDQMKSGVQGLKSQATEKVRAYAVDGKDRATTALDDLSQVVNEAAQSIDDRLGAQYGDYARRAATAVSGFADTVRGKNVDELFEDARDIVRKSPGVAIGAAAVIGFSLIRLLKAGMPDQQNTDVDFQPDPALSGPGGGIGQSSSTSQAPYVAPNTTTGV